MSGINSSTDASSLQASVLERLPTLLGQQAVLLPLPLRQKGPKIPAWQKLTYAQTQAEAYRRELSAAVERGGNLGCLLGPPSDNLVAIDIDLDPAVEPFLELNPALSNT